MDRIRRSLQREYAAAQDKISQWSRPIVNRIARKGIDSGVVFVFGSIAMRRGGVTRAILARMKLFAEAGIHVRLLLTGHGAREDQEEAAIRRAWQLPRSVEIRYFWREAAPGGGGAPVDSLVSADSEPGLTALSQTSKSAKVVRLYADGLLVKSKHFNPDGTLLRVDHHDGLQRVMSRDYFDPRGRLVRIDTVRPDTALAALRRWYDSSGRCWLTIALNKDGRPTSAVRHRPSPESYSNIGQCVAQWVDEVLEGEESPVVFSDTRNQDHVLLALKHPSARKVAVLHNCHTSRPHRSDDAVKGNWKPLLRALDAFDTVIALTNQQRDDIVRRFSGGRFRVINHPTPPPATDGVRREQGLLVAVCRLEGQKRLDHAIRAFSIAAKRVPTAQFDIYGTGSEATVLKRLVKELGIQSRVNFRGFTDRPLDAFAGATATVLSSWFEGFPLVLNEAMSVGTPFVAYDINYGPAEVIRPDVDGLLVPDGDIEALGDAMTRVLGDPRYAEELGTRAREVMERFSEERWSREWLDLYATFQRKR